MASTSKADTSEVDMDYEISSSMKRRNPRRIAAMDLFKIPPKRHTAKQRPIPSSQPTNLTNHYDTLSDASSESSEAPGKKKRPSPEPINNVIESPPSFKNGERKSMPIRVLSTTFVEIQATLNSLSLKTRPTVKKEHASQFKITTYSMDDKRKIIEKLNAKNIGNFIYCEREERKLIFVPRFLGLENREVEWGAGNSGAGVENRLDS
jgi:hypothetical protein